MECSSQVTCQGDSANSPSASGGRTEERRQLGVDQKLVLFVEDSEDDRRLYTHFLTQNGYRVITAADGREGIKIAVELLPDLILMDLWLPVMGGWQATSQLKKDDRTKHIPVVAVTGHSPLRSEVVGCDGMLMKPISPEVLLTEIQRLLAGDVPVRN